MTEPGPSSGKAAPSTYDADEAWGWAAVAAIVALLLGAIVVYSPPDLADRSASAALDDQETTGRGTR